MQPPAWLSVAPGEPLTLPFRSILPKTHPPQLHHTQKYYLKVICLQVSRVIGLGEGWKIEVMGEWEQLD